jgi:hypothetical protein
MGDAHRGRTAGLAQKRRNVAAVVKLPAAVLPAASCRELIRREDELPMPAVMFTPQAPRACARDGRVTTAPAPLIVLDENAALVPSVTM